MLLSSAGSMKAKAAANARLKKITVSSDDDTRVETKGARHQLPRRSRSKIATSRSCAARKAVPEAMSWLRERVPFQIAKRARVHGTM